MTSISSDLLPAIEVETGKNPTHTILWLHGLGAAGDDFVPIVNELALPASTRVRFLFPHAPMREVSINRGMLMRAWYDFDMIDPAVGLHENLASLRESQRAIEALIVREEQRGIPPGRLFSQVFPRAAPWRSRRGCATVKSWQVSWRCPHTCRRRKRSRRKRTTPIVRRQFSWRTGTATTSYPQCLPWHRSDSSANQAMLWNGTSTGWRIRFAARSWTILAPG